MATLLDGLNEAPNVTAALNPQPSVGTPTEQLDGVYGNEFTKGLRRGTLGMLGTTQAFGGSLLEPFAPKMAESLFAEAQNTLNYNKGLRPRVNTFDEVNSLGTLGDYAASKIGEAAPTSAASIAAGLAGGVGAAGLRAVGARTLSPLAAGTLAGGASMFPQEAGESAMTLRDDPMVMANTTPAQRLAMASGKGAVNSALEILPERLVAGRIMHGAPTRGVRGAVGEFGKTLGEAALTEGATEGAQEFVGQQVHSLANPLRDTSSDLGSIKEAAIGGAFGGVGLGAAGGATSAARGVLARGGEVAQDVAQEFPAGMEAGYKTAKFLNEQGGRAADFIGRKLSDLHDSVDRYVKASVGWTDAKQRTMDDLGDKLDGLSDEQKKAVVTALHLYDEAPKRVTPEIEKALADALGEAPTATREYLKTVQAQRAAAARQEKVDAINKLPHASDETKQKLIAALDKQDERGVVDTSTVSLEKNDDGTELEHGETAIKGDLKRLFPTLDQPITKDVLQRSLQSEHFMRRGGGKVQAHLPIYAKSDTLSAEEILKHFKLKDRQDNTDIERDHTPEEIADRTKGGYARLHIRPFSLANEVSRTPKREDYKTDEEHQDALKSHFDGMPDYRDEFQTGTSNSRKGDLFMHSMTTLLNEGMDITDDKGVTHHVEFRTGNRGVPDNLALGPMQKGGTAYTKADYASEKPAWTPKDREALKVEREVTKEYQALEDSSYKWGTKAKAELASLDDARRAAKGSDQYAPLNRRYQALNSLMKTRNALAAKELTQALVKRGVTQQEIDENSVWDLATKEEKNAAFATATKEVHKKVRARNARGLVNDDMKTLYGALQDKVLDRLQAGERTPELIDHLEEYLNGDADVEDYPDLKKFFEENGVTPYTQEQLQHPVLKNDKGKTPQDWLLGQLEFLKKTAEESDLGGTRSQEEISDIMSGRTGMTKNAPSGNSPYPAALGRNKSEDSVPVKVPKLPEPKKKETVTSEKRFLNQKADFGPQEKTPVIHTKAPVEEPSKPPVKEPHVRKPSQVVVDDFGNRVRRDYRGKIVAAMVDANDNDAMAQHDKEIKEYMAEHGLDTVYLRQKFAEIQGGTEEDKAYVQKLLDKFTQLERIANGEFNVHNLAQKTVDSWSKKYAGGTRVHIAKVPKSEKELLSTIAAMVGTGDIEKLGGMYVKINGKHFLVSPETQAATNRVTSLQRLAHEFGHALQNIAFDKADPDVKEKVIAAYMKDVAALAVHPGAVKNFVSTARFGFTNEQAQMYGRSLKLSEKGQRNEAVEGLAQNIMESGMQNTEHRAYLTSFPEWFAENFSKYVTSGDRTTMEPEVAKFWQGLLKTLKDYFRYVVHQFKPDVSFAEWVDSLAAGNVVSQTPETSADQTAAAPPAQPPSEPPRTPPPSGPAGSEGSENPAPQVAERLVAKVKQMFGKTVRIGVGTPDDAKPGENAWYVGRRQLDEYKANIAKLKTVREARRTALREGDMAAVRRLEMVEERLLKNTQVLGLIYLAPHLAEREHEAKMYHESIHAAFDILLTPEERAVLGTAFTKGTVGRRLREIYKDQPDVLKHMEDAEEAAAYGFEIYAMAPEQLQLGAKVKNIFDRIIKFFRELAGIMTPDEKAKIIMDDILSGRRAETGLSPIQKKMEKDMTIPEKMTKLARTFGTVVKAGWDVIAKSSYERLNEMDNPAIKRIADAGYTKPGSQSERLGYIHAQRAAMNRFINGLDKAFKDYSPDTIKAAAEHRIMGTVPTDTAELGAYNALNKFFTDMHKYAVVDRGVAMGFEKNYFPLHWDAEKVLNNKEAFLAMIKKPEYEERLAELKVTPNELWENIANYITRGESFQDLIGKKTKEPANQFAKERSLSFIKPEDRRPFMNDDHLQTLVTYVQQMTRQAEFVHAYGNKGEKLDAWMKEAKEKYGATPEQLALAKDYVDGLLGDKAVGMSRAQKDLYGALIVYQNFRLLPLNLFSSLVDPLGIAIRSNSLSDASDTFLYNIRHIFRGLKEKPGFDSKDKWEKLSTDWGIIEDSGTMSNLGAMYDTIDIRGMNRRLQDALFKYNLLNGWERNTKIMATKAAHRFMVRLKEGFFEGDNERYMRELGVKPSDLVLKPDGELALTSEELQAQGVSEAQAKEIESHLQTAVTKFVNQSVLNPTAADFPNWGSNPYFAPVFHLKQYMFTFQSTILKRIVDEAKMGNLKPAWVASIYIPGMIGADMMRGFIQNMGEEPPWKKKWTTMDYFYNGVDRSGLMGTGGLITGVKDDILHGGTGFESLMGPTLEQLKKGVVAMESGNAAKVNWLVRAAPLNPLYGTAITDPAPPPKGD